MCFCCLFIFWKFCVVLHSKQTGIHANYDISVVQYCKSNGTFCIYEWIAKHFSLFIMTEPRNNKCFSILSYRIECVCDTGYRSGEIIHMYKGDRCEIVIDYCERQPCQAGSTCVSKIGSYQCLCQPG